MNCVNFHTFSFKICPQSDSLSVTKIRRFKSGDEDPTDPHFPFHYLERIHIFVSCSENHWSGFLFSFLLVNIPDAASRFHRVFPTGGLQLFYRSIFQNSTLDGGSTIPITFMVVTFTVCFGAELRRCSHPGLTSLQEAARAAAKLMIQLFTELLN